MHTAGFLTAALWGASRKQEVRCVDCANVYQIDTRGTRIAGLLLWIFMLLLITGAVGQKFLEQ